MDWFTSDTHFGHKNIIRYANRPYTDTNHMDEGIINNWNSVVKPEDRVFHLGDFGLTNSNRCQSILNRLNGQKHLIVGNHEKASIDLEGWNWVKPYAEIKSGDQHIVLCHYAMRVWHRSHYGSWMLYGHSHGSLPDDPTALSIDVGVDCHDMYPINTNQIRSIMKRKAFEPVDHHKKVVK